ncbi:MAG: histidine phosphotransferase family protein [Dongiaceae bacterium]
MGLKLDLRVMELMASRVCHDLISPVGAIGNGLELLEDADGEMAKEALKLSANCVRKASALLEYFRMAYGAAGSGDALRWESAKTLAAGIVEGGKVTLTWPDLTADLKPPPGTAKFVLNLVLMASEMLPRGGEVSVSLEPTGGGLKAMATANGRDARITEELAATLAAGADGVAALSAKTVHGYFTARLAESLGGRLDVAVPRPGASVQVSAVLAAA